jgi:phosphate butyryltransferase
MEKPILLVVAPDDHYIESVAERAGKDGLIGGFRVARADSESFADALSRLDKGNLIIAKGMLETADFLRLILKYNDKELIADGGTGFLSHCTIFVKKGIFRRSRPIILTDAAINIDPDAEKKVKIVKNAIDLARRLLGISRPVASILTPAGKLNPAISSSVDGDRVIRRLAAESAEIRLDQMDTAIDAGARAVKKLAGGPADILLADRLDDGNNIYKLYTNIGGYDAAGLVCGAAVPVVLNSRSDSARSKLLSIEYAVRLLGRQK